MRLLSTLTALSLVAVLVVNTSDAEAGKTKKKKKHVVHGVVTHVHHNKENGTGTITVRVHHKNKKGSAQEYTERKFHVTAATKFEKVIHVAKGQNQHEAATFAVVHKGEHVAVAPIGDKSHDAASVAIEIRKKKKV